MFFYRSGDIKIIPGKIFDNIKNIFGGWVVVGLGWVGFNSSFSGFGETKTK